MSKEVDSYKPYTAIPGYFETSPAELSRVGGPMEYSPRLTAMARETLNMAFSEIIIDYADIELYRSTSPAVVVPPHRSMLDMSLLSHLGELSREGQPYFLSKRENMNNRATAKFFGHMRTFPIDRHKSEVHDWSPRFTLWSKFALSDGANYDEQLGLADKPRKLVIFGEGTRKTGLTIEKMKGGPLVAARKNKALVLPVGIAGTDKLKVGDMRGAAVITVGEPYKVTDSRDTETLIAKVQEQFDRANKMLEEYEARILT